MRQTDHAQAMAERFRELVEEAGDSLADRHYEELKLIIEAGLDTALVESIDKITGELNQLAQKIQNRADFFE